MISKKLVEALNEQVNAEMWSANLYLSMSVHFSKEGLDGFASWMKAQYKEEMDHAFAFMDYIVKRGGEASIGQINVVPTGWGTPEEIFEHSYKHEIHISDMINKLTDFAAAEKDKATQDFLWGFVREQVEEEASAKAIVDKIKLAGTAGLLFLDAQLGARK